ncbi:antitoxin family protein [Tolypothrix sp. VBCCA 56010]|uniref:antitoxin family protein n=1 Tax=Tolypothrix sp. VBCCA 56010 TaxID=3137731 RepID=UPI003D7DAB7B
MRLLIGMESPFMPHVKAIYRNGAFVLQTPCNLAEGTEVELFIQSPQVVSPSISDAETKQRFLKSLVERMQQNPIPSNAPRFTREMLHERR